DEGRVGKHGDRPAGDVDAHRLGTAVDLVERDDVLRIRPAGRVVELPVAGERSLRSVRLAEPEVEVVADLPGEDDPAIGSWGRRAQGQSPAVVRQLPLLARGELELPEVCSVGVAPDEDVTRAGGVDPSAECVRRLPGAEE